MTTTTLYTAGVVLIVLALAVAVHTASAREASDTRERFRGRQQIYVIATGMDMKSARRPIKIGIGKNPTDRLRDGKTWSPHGIVVYHTWKLPDARAVEKEAHTRLAKFRTDAKNEWFDIDPENAVSLVNMVMGQPRPGWRPALRRAWLWWKAGRVAR